MDHAKKMVLVSPDMLNNMEQASTSRGHLMPTTKKVNSLDSDLSAVLNSDLPVDQKMLEYSQLLNRYQTYVKKDRQPAQIQLVSSKPPSTAVADKDTEKSEKEVDVEKKDGGKGMDHVEDEILDSVPKSMYNRAKALVKKMKMSNGELSYNNRGELIVRGEPIRNSNIVDLINDVLRRRKHFNPQGWQHFAQGLADINTPIGILGHPDRQNYVQQYMSGNIPEETPMQERAPIASSTSTRLETTTPRGGRGARRKHHPTFLSL